MDKHMLLEPPRETTSHDAEMGEAAVWSIPLEAGPEEYDLCFQTLCAEERNRASRFHFEVHRRRFIVGRGRLRRILGRYLQTKPEIIEFEYGPSGKPALGGKWKDTGVQFNLAHCDDLALLAVAVGHEVGVDLERLREIPDASDLVTRFFCPSEAALFEALPDEQKVEGFFNLWTRKEAWLKATGEGITQLLNQVEVTFLPSTPAQLLAVPSGYRRGDWELHALKPKPGFVAALALAPGATFFQCKVGRWNQA